MKDCEWCGNLIDPQNDNGTDYCDRVCLAAGGGEVLVFDGEDDE